MKKIFLLSMYNLLIFNIKHVHYNPHLTSYRSSKMINADWAQAQEDAKSKAWVN